MCHNKKFHVKARLSSGALRGLELLIEPVTLAAANVLQTKLQNLKPKDGQSLKVCV